jgi:CRP-like cAMP-binding protein
MLIIERVAALNKATIFADVHDHALVEIAQVVREISVEAGETIIREGDDENWMLVLVAGAARVFAGGLEIAAIGPGASVGELALIDPAPRSATVMASEPCHLFRIDRAPFREIMEEQPELVSALLTMLIRMVRAAPRPPSTAG